MGRGMGKDKVSPDRGVTKISIDWHYEDIIERSEYVGRVITITKKSAREILYNLKEGHDKAIGINWDVIDEYTDDYLRQNR